MFREKRKQGFVLFLCFSWYFVVPCWLMQNNIVAEARDSRNGCYSRISVNSSWSMAVPQNTYIPRVPQCLSPCWNWDPPLPPASECVPTPELKGGGGHTRLRVKGWGSPNFGRLEKKPSTLSTLWAIHLNFNIQHWRMPMWVRHSVCNVMG